MKPIRDFRSMFSIIEKQNAEKYDDNDRNENIILIHWWFFYLLENVTYPLTFDILFIDPQFKPIIIF